MSAGPDRIESVALRNEPTPEQILATPAGFAAGILQLALYPWQGRVLTEFERPGWVTAVCCNEAGKTTFLAAPLILWVMTVFPGCQVVVTSGSWRQVKEQLFPALKRFSGRFPGWTFDDTRLESPKGSRCVGFSTDDAGLFEGFHVGAGGHRDTPLLIIVDEAKSVAEPIFQAVDRCRPTWLLLMSSPGLPFGRFYDSHTKHRSQYRAHKVTVADCPHVDPAVINKIRTTYGDTHPFTRSTLWAEFTEDAGSGLIITLAQVQACLATPPAKTVGGERHAWCDFAAGGDENVLALREGNTVRIVKAWREADTMRACGEFIAAFRKLGLAEDEITGDDDGLGTVMLDRLAELGWAINRANSNAKAMMPQVYANRAAEIWGEGAQKIERKQLVLPDDPVLLEQLTTRRWKRQSEGTLQLVSKREMKKEGLNSPDRADAVLGCAQPVANYRPANYGAHDPFAAQAQSSRRYAGFNAGGY